VACTQPSLRDAEHSIRVEAREIEEEHTGTEFSLKGSENFVGIYDKSTSNLVSLFVRELDDILYSVAFVRPLLGDR
jgi:hypothetical protein